MTPYRVDASVGEVMDRMTSLEVVQTLTAGVDNVRSAVPDGVRLCSGRGIHDSSTAELALTLVLASLRGVPGFVRAPRPARRGRLSGGRRWPTSTSCSWATAPSAGPSRTGCARSRPP